MFYIYNIKKQKLFINQSYNKNIKKQFKYWI